jgi:hemerythrin-like domain-containing protein
MANTKPRGRSALTMLREDHRNVQKLFREFKRAKEDSEKQRIVETACQELKVHAQIEEEIFYPEARSVLKQSDLLDEAKVEHESAKQLIAQLEGMSPEDELYDAKFTVLGEYVNHHIKEEQDEMFPKIEKTDLDLKELGARLTERKEELVGEMGGEPSGRRLRFTAR